MFDLNAKFPLRDRGISNGFDASKAPRHRWYFVKEGFSPNLVKEAISKEGLKKGDLIFDPFSGSGTVPLAGVEAGMRAQSFEVNPFLKFLSSTKLKHSSPKKLLDSSEFVSRGLARPHKSLLDGFSTFTKGNRWNRWLFPRAVLESYEGGRQALSRVPGVHRDLLQLALLAATMDCCNAFRDGKCLRYPVGWQDHEASAYQLMDKFQEKVWMFAEDLMTNPLREVSVNITEGDARQLVRRDSKDRFRLCITSPPYLNSFDYSDVYRPELFLGNFVQSNVNLMSVRLKTVRSHVQANWKAPNRDHFGGIYTECISRLRDEECILWNKRIPEMVQAYFEDMETILSGLRQRALPSASIWIVVSTSAYGGVEVPVDFILAEIGQRAGWFLREIGVLRYLRSASQHSKYLTSEERKGVPLRESVVILDATGKKS